MKLERESPIIVDPDDPWLNDKLNRKQIGVNLTTLLKTINSSFVLAINAPWGRGKTSFVNMWKGHLEKQDFHCIYFNCWENDFQSEPLIALISEFENFIATYRTNDTDTIKSQNKLEKVKEKSGRILTKLAPLALQMLSRGVIKDIDDIQDIFSGQSQEDISKFIGEYAKAEIDEFQKKKDALQQFKDSLTELIALLQGFENVENRKPLIFFIDELDRCRPPYAIHLLERIKHLFNVDNLIFVLSVDMGQLAQAAKVLYGNEMDSAAYFRRLIDLEFDLPKPNLKDLIKLYSDRFGLTNSQFVYRSPWNINSFESYVLLLCKTFDISSRELLRFYNIFNIAFRLTYNNLSASTAYPLLCLLIVLRIKYRSIYEKLLEGEKGLAIFQQLTQEKRFTDLFYNIDASERYGSILGAYIILINLNNTEIETYLKQIGGKERDDVEESVLYLVRNGIGKNFFEGLVNSLEFTENFPEVV